MATTLLEQRPAPSGAVTEDRNATVWGLFEKHARTHPRKTAIVDGETEIDYQRLAMRAEAIAVALGARGVEPGALVGVCMHRNWELLATLMGVLRAGCAYVPLDPTYPRERVQYMVEHARLAAAVVDHEQAAEICQGAPELIRVQDVEEAGTVLKAADRLAGPAPRDLAYVIYTSGSTGRPKGVAIEHRSVVALSQSMRLLLSDEELTGVLAAASICFDASVLEILGTLSLGGTVILAKNPLHLLELPAAERVRTCVMVPSAMKALLAAGELPKGVLCVILGAEVLTPSLVEQIRFQKQERRVINVYGPTEDTVYSTTVEVPLGAETVTIGKSVPGSRAYILNDAMQKVPRGVEGELYLAGNKLARGYLHDEERTKERFLTLDPAGPVPEERLYKTGDLCRWREDGEIEFLGRLDQQVKIRGQRVELEEIEATLEAMNGVEGAAAAVVDGGGGQKILVGYIVASDASVTSEAARAHLAERLPGYMVPQVVMFLDELPRLPNDKLDRKKLPKPNTVVQETDGQNVSDQDLGVGEHSTVVERGERHATLLTAVQKEVASLLRLGDPERVQPDGLLTELGLDSLSQVELGSRLGAAIDCKLPVTALVDRSTPNEVADYLLGVTANGNETTAPKKKDRAVDALGSFQKQIQEVYPPFLAAKAASWSASDKGTLVREIKQLVSRPGDPFCKLVRTGSGHRGVVADVDTDRSREAIIWTTNLYLGLNRDPEVIQEAREAVERFGTGMGTSAAASGITDVHLEFEQAFADLVGKPSACLFPTGYTANVGAVAGLLGTKDVIVMDQLCHASIVDGARLCGAKIRTFQHNNPADLQAVLESEASPYRTILVVIEGVYSMGEGAAPVLEIARTAKRYGALVLVDEAHSFGFYGARGGGISAEQGATDQVDFIMTTLSKALGSLGGVVAGSEEHVALLKSSSRAFIFQASTSPADMAAALAALRRLSTDDALRERLWDTTRYMRQRFTEAGYDLGTGDGPIVTPHFYDKEKLFAIVNGLFERGIHTSAVTYPIVEVGRGRLRFICSAAHSREDVDRTLEALQEAEHAAEQELATRPSMSPTDDANVSAVRADVETWATEFSTYLKESVARIPGLTPDLAVSVDVLDDGEAVTIRFNEEGVTINGCRPTETASCLLNLKNQAVSNLCGSDVQELLDDMLNGRLTLSGDVEPFVWLIARLADWQRYNSDSCQPTRD